MSKLCENCVVEHCADRNRGQVVFCSSHTTKPIQTHADCIRAENNDELKGTIHAFSLGFKPWCDFHCKNEGDDGCDKCIENWLQQPAKNPVEWSKTGPCPVTPDQFNAVYDDAEA
jgi:hypothetical protein